MNLLKNDTPAAVKCKVIQAQIPSFANYSYL